MNTCYPFVNTPLPYEYNSLEPFIDEKTMYLHHDRHLQTYIDNLNSLIEANPALQKWTLQQFLLYWHRLPLQLQIPVRNNAGGVYNHRFFFNGMKNPEDASHGEKLINEINKQYNCFEDFKSQFKKAALSVFGSGYAWLVTDRRKLKIITTANQNTPIEHGQIPLLNIDVWEHAYYLKHYNVRAAYIDDWFNVINWEMIEQRFKNSF